MAGAESPDRPRQRLEGDEPEADRAYRFRHAPTPGGVEKMQRGELEPFDLEMYANLNTGALEEYLDARTRREGFARSAWPWRRVALGVLVGAVFAAVNVFVGLRTGLIVYGAWYVAFLVGAGRRWGPASIHAGAGAANGASFVVTGLVYALPAAFLLASAEGVELGVAADVVPGTWALVAATAAVGILGAVAFASLRRAWLVEDPLPYPSFESFLRLLEMTHDISAGAARRARHGVRLLVAASGVGALFAFLRDVPLVRRAPGADAEPVLTAVTGGASWYSSAHGISMPASAAHYSWVGFALSPLVVAVGWFMRAPAAAAVAAGSAFVWFLAVPLAVYFDMPVYRPGLGGEVGLEALWAAGEPSALLAFTGIFRTMAAGALVGAGLTALLKMAPTGGGALRDLARIRAPRRGDEREGGRGWFEWPASHAWAASAVALVALAVAFTATGASVVVALAVAALVVASTFVLGVIAVKSLGETSVQPVSGTSVIVVVVVALAARALGAPVGVAAVAAVVAAALHASAVAVAGDALLNQKIAIFVGTTPASQLKAHMSGLVPAALVGVVAAVAASVALVAGRVELAAPHAHAFAAVAAVASGGSVDLTLLFLGVAIGVFVEVVTGLGAGFAIGMFLPVSVAAPLLVGGVARDLWERRVLESRATREGWDEEKRTIRLLDSFMLAAGLVVGEALVGVGIAIYLSAGVLGGA